MERFFVPLQRIWYRYDDIDDKSYRYDNTDEKHYKDEEEVGRTHRHLMERAHEGLILAVALHWSLQHGIAVVRILVGDMLYGAGDFLHHFLNNAAKLR